MSRRRPIDSRGVRESRPSRAEREVPILPHPVVFVPGTTASVLSDQHPIPPEVVWSATKKRFDRLAMHPDDLRYESHPPARTRPEQVFALAYEEMVEDLRDELADQAGAEVSVYPFAYDWRHPLAVTQQRLADFVEEVIERTRLMRHDHKAYGSDLKVGLVGHSMGGLVVARYPTDQAPGRPVAKVITLAALFRSLLALPRENARRLAKLDLSRHGLGIEDRLVLVRPDDYGFWEIGDKALTLVGGFHGILPNMNLAQRLVLRFLTDGSDRYGNTWGRAAPGVDEWNPPLSPPRRKRD